MYVWYELCGQEAGATSVYYNWQDFLEGSAFFSRSPRTNN